MICGTLEDLACLAYRNVIWDPVVCDRDADGPALITDLGVWGVCSEALIDMHVFTGSVTDVLFNGFTVGCNYNHK